MNPFIAGLCLLIIHIPLFFKLWRDRKGSRHPNHDWIWVGIIMLSCSVLVVIISDRQKNVYQALALSFFSYNALFPYLVNITMRWNKVPGIGKDWWNQLSATAWPDKEQSWRDLDWRVRMFILAIPLAGAIKLYLCWGKFLSFDSTC